MHQKINVKKARRKNRSKNLITYVRLDGTPTKNAVYSNVDQDTGKVHFYEIIGQTGVEGIPYAYIDGKCVYRRILIQQVYPKHEAIKNPFKTDCIL